MLHPGLNTGQNNCDWFIDWEIIWISCLCPYIFCSQFVLNFFSCLGPSFSFKTVFSEKNFKHIGRGGE